MVNEKVLEKVVMIVAEALNLDDVPSNAAQEEFVEWDSMAYLTIISGIEDEFGVSITERNIDNFGSISSIIEEILIVS